MKINEDNIAVSEILGTLLMLMLGAIIFSIVSVILLSPSSAPAPQYVKIECEIIDENITITHQGGDALSLNIEITFKIDNNDHIFLINGLLEDEYKDDGFWNIGDQIIHHAGNLENLPVEIVIVDLDKNFLLLNEILQE